MVVREVFVSYELFQRRKLLKPTRWNNSVVFAVLFCVLMSWFYHKTDFESMHFCFAVICLVDKKRTEKVESVNQ